MGQHPCSYYTQLKRSHTLEHATADTWDVEATQSVTQKGNSGTRFSALYVTVF